METSSVPLTQETVSGEEVSYSEQKPMSKNSLKKIAKAEKFAALKLERRAREKEAKKEKKRQRAEKRAAGELDEEDDEERKRQSKKRKVQFGGNVIIDLGFDDMMNDKEIVSLCSQLAYTYSANRNAAYPFSLICTSLNGRTHQRLESLGDASYKRWASAEWMSESYEHLWKKPADPLESSEATTASKPSVDADEAGLGDEHIAGTTAAGTAGPSRRSTSLEITQNSVVYLTADTEDELTELRTDETYIIGGICDHNRYKNLCLNRAKESGIRTARLPIGRYLASLPTRKVLTVNQVFEILVKWVETKDWGESLYSVIPERKFRQGGKANHDANSDTIVVEEDADHGDAAEEQHPHGL